MNKIVTFVFLLSSLFIACKDNKKNSPTVSEVFLTHYQKTVLSPKTYKGFRDLYGNIIQFQFDKHQIPVIKSGTITITEKVGDLYETIKILHFKDSLLTVVKDHNEFHLEYNSDRKLVKYSTIAYYYKNGELTKAESEVSKHTFEKIDNCVIWKIVDNNSGYTNKSKLCFDHNNKLISDIQNYTLKNRNISEQVYFTYDSNAINAITRLEIENSDTVTFLKYKFTNNKLGLLETLTKIDMITKEPYSEKYSYEILSSNPLVVKTKKFVYNQINNESLYTFNEHGQLVENVNLGKYGSAYKILYNEL